MCRRFSFALLIAFVTLAGGPGKAVAQDQGEARFELLHLWAEEIEAHALAAFSEPMREAGVDWSEHILRNNFRGVRETFSERLAHGIAPTAVFWIGGGDSVEVLIEQGILRGIVPQPGTEQFRQRLLPEVFEEVRYGNGLSLLPVGIHIMNYIVYDRRVLTEIGEGVPANWEDFVRLAEKAHRAGYYGLSLSDETWQLRNFLGAVLASYLNTKEMQALASRDEINEVHRRALTKSFELIKRLRPYLNPDFNNLSWAQAAAHVVEGRALAHVQGDFITPLIPNQTDFICALPPGNNYVTWAFDSIALTNTDNPSEIMGQNLFVETVLDPEHTARYISRKGGVPIEKNFSRSSLEGCALISVSAWEQSPDKVSWFAAELTESMELIASFAHDYINNPEIDVDVISGELFKTLETLQIFEPSD
ncbi:extracellular solute-binding protein [Rhodovulum imhoffii]|nr:extracellular solute-binding protein [Rhodovulum imhoffii]